MILYRINATAYEEDDFFLLTDISEKDVDEVIKPLILGQKRDGLDEYDAESMHKVLMKKYPTKKITLIKECQVLSY